MTELVLVTGSSGLVGHALCRALHAHFLVVGFDREGNPYPPPDVHWIFVDMTSDESVQNGMHIVETRFGNRIASVCHLAAYYDFSGRPSKLYKEITLSGTERLFRELERFEVEQFIFSSSMLVHEPARPGIVIDEDSPIGGTWPYPKSKIEAEQLISKIRGGIKTISLRIAGVYNDYCHSIPIASQIQRTYEKSITSHFYPGNTTAGQSFVHVDDVIDCFVSAIKRRHNLPDELVLLIGESETLSYLELQSIIEQKLFGGQLNIMQIPKPVAKFGAWFQDSVIHMDTFIKPWMVDRADDHYALNIARAQHYLNWQPKRSLRDTLPIMIRTLKEDPIGWYQMNKLHLPSWLSRRGA